MFQKLCNSDPYDTILVQDENYSKKRTKAPNFGIILSVFLFISPRELKSFMEAEQLYSVMEVIYKHGWFLMEMKLYFLEKSEKIQRLIHKVLRSEQTTKKWKPHEYGKDMPIDCIIISHLHTGTIAWSKTLCSIIYWHLSQGHPSVHHSQDLNQFINGS